MVSIGQSVQDLLPAGWEKRARKRAFYRCSDKLETDDGTPYAFANDGDGWPIIPAHRRETDSPEQLAAMNPSYANDPALLMARSRQIVGGLDETIAARRRLTRPVAYVRKIADHYVAHVMRVGSVATGESIDRWNEWTPTAGGAGASLDAMLRAAMRAAMVEGSAGVLVDWIGGTPGSIAGLSPASVVVRLVSADHILWTKRDSIGTVREAGVVLAGDDGEPFLWIVTATTCQRCELSKGKVTMLGEALPHGYGRCPLFVLDRLPSIIPGVAEGQKAIARTDSLLRFRCHEDAIPWQVLTGVANSVGAKAQLLQMPLVTILEDANAKAQILGADIAVAESLRQTMRMDEEQLYEDAKVRPVAATGAPESGVAHAYRWVDADVELATASEEMERAEQHVAACVATQLAWEDTPKIRRPRSFVPFDRGAALTGLAGVSASTLPDAIKRREMQAAAALLYPSDPDAVDDIGSELSRHGQEA